MHCKLCGEKIGCHDGLVDGGTCHRGVAGVEDHSGVRRAPPSGGVHLAAGLPAAGRGLRGSRRLCAHALVRRVLLALGGRGGACLGQGFARGCPGSDKVHVQHWHWTFAGGRKIGGEGLQAGRHEAGVARGRPRFSLGVAHSLFAAGGQGPGGEITGARIGTLQGCAVLRQVAAPRVVRCQGRDGLGQRARRGLRHDHAARAAQDHERGDQLGRAPPGPHGRLAAARGGGEAAGGTLGHHGRDGGTPHAQVEDRCARLGRAALEEGRARHLRRREPLLRLAEADTRTSRVVARCDSALRRCRSRSAEDTRHRPRRSPP
mmetsp:Transcript_132803/g.424908  ORF Transcript_132803/g.424908 Transcript_132803/m.424908 type:complete len:318 (+) Transcript_132803:462-1415(+)